MKKLTPGEPGESTSSGRPIMLLLELLGRKQTLRIVWELKDQAATFRALQERCGGISPTILNHRLGDMREAGIVEHQPGRGYYLSKHGVDLIETFAPLNQWAQKWAKRTKAKGQNTV